MNRYVLADTGFVITLLVKTRPHHETAKQYFKYFLDHEHILYFSTIGIAEYCHKGTIDELPLKQLITLPFNAIHAVKTAELNFKAHRVESDARDAVKDDFKMIAQAVVEQCGFIITEDRNTLAKYSDRLREEGKLDARVIILEDGYDEALVNPENQRYLDI